MGLNGEGSGTGDSPVCALAAENAETVMQAQANKRTAWRKNALASNLRKFLVNYDYPLELSFNQLMQQIEKCYTYKNDN